MADTDYNYTKSLVAVDRLENEIRASAILTSLAHATTLGSALTVTMRDVLSSDDQTILDAIVSAHAGMSLVYPAPLVRIDQPLDSDNMPISRNKITKTGWTFNRANLKFQVGVAGVRYRLKDGVTEQAGVTLKLFNAAGTDITSSDQATLDTDCVMTQLDYEPPYNNEILAGSLVMMTAPVGDMWLWVIGVPDLPAIYGGSKEFVTDEGLHFLKPQVALVADGRASKPLTYSGAPYHTNKIRAVIRHTAGDKVRMQMTYQQFKA